jgi:hypothetical protein
MVLYNNILYGIIQSDDIMSDLWGVKVLQGGLFFSEIPST